MWNAAKAISEKEAFYVDGNNIAISYNSPYLCKQCYEKVWGPMKYDILISIAVLCVLDYERRGGAKCVNTNVFEEQQKC